MWRMMMFVIFLAAAGAATAEQISADQVRVIDGDTVRLFNKKPNVRLVGFNAPELGVLCVTLNASLAIERQGGFVI